MTTLITHATAPRCVPHGSGSGRYLSDRRKGPAWVCCLIPAWRRVREAATISDRIPRTILGAVAALILLPVGVAQSQAVVLIAVTAAILSPGETLYLSLAPTRPGERTEVGSDVTTYQIVVSKAGVDAESCVQVLDGSLSMDAPRRTAALTALGRALTMTFDGEPGPREVILDDCFAGSPQILVEFRVPLPGQRAIDPPHFVVAGAVARGTETRIATEEPTIVHDDIERVR
jgi:hypothetical protein